MINIFQQPTKENPTLGFTFLVFSQEQFGMSYRKLPDLTTAEAEFKIEKCNCVIMNMETFHRFSNKLCDGQVEKEAVKAIRECCNTWLTRKFNYVEFLEDVIKKANFMRTLVQAMPEQKKVSGIMMASTIINFCKAELADEHKKNQG